MNSNRILKTNITIIGGGFGGISAAIRSSQLKKNVILIEKKTLGGSYINHGGIASKFLLYYTGLIQNIDKKKDFGIKIKNLYIDLRIMNQKKENLRKKMIKDIKGILQKHNIKVISGFGKIISPNNIIVEKRREKLMIETDNIIISTGSRPILPQIPGAHFAITSEKFLKFEKIPKNAIILGGGPEGVEFATILNNIGVKCKIIELTKRLLPLEDKEISKIIKKIFIKKGNEIKTNSNLESIYLKNNNKYIQIIKNNKKEKLSADSIILALGRKPNSDRLGLEDFPIQVNNGFIIVNNNMVTNIPNIYAIGDVVGGGSANAALEQGNVAAENAAGLKTEFNRHIVPRCIYTNPEIASIGITESTAKELNLKLKIGKSIFRNNNKALIINELDGFIKVLINSSTNKIIGIHMIGNSVSEIISEASLLLNIETDIRRLSKVNIPTTSLSSTFMEALRNFIN